VSAADTLNSARAVRAIEILRAGGYVQWFKKDIGCERYGSHNQYWSFRKRLSVWDCLLRDANGQRVAGIGRTTLDALRAAGLMVRDANDHGREVWAADSAGGAA